MSGSLQKRLEELGSWILQMRYAAICMYSRPPRQMSKTICLEPVRTILIMPTIMTQQ